MFSYNMKEKREYKTIGVKTEVWKRLATYKSMNDYDYTEAIKVLLDNNKSFEPLSEKAIEEVIAKK